MSLRTPGTAPRFCRCPRRRAAPHGREGGARRRCARGARDCSVRPFLHSLLQLCSHTCTVLCLLVLASKVPSLHSCLLVLGRLTGHVAGSAARDEVAPRGRAETQTGLGSRERRAGLGSRGISRTRCKFLLYSFWTNGLSNNYRTYYAGIQCSRRRSSLVITGHRTPRRFPAPC